MHTSAQSCAICEQTRVFGLLIPRRRPKLSSLCRPTRHLAADESAPVAPKVLVQSYSVVGVSSYFFGVSGNLSSAVLNAIQTIKRAELV